MSTNMNTIINANTSALKGTDPFKSFQAFVSNFFIDALKNDIIDDEVFEKINTMFKSPSVYKALKTDIRPRTTTKTKRDPAKPLKPATTFFRFAKEQRPAITAAMQKIAGENKVKSTDVTKAIAAEWKTYKEDAENKPKGKAAKQLAAWNVEIEQEKVAYLEAMKDYVPVAGVDSDSSSKKSKGPAKTDPTKPKRPPSEYILYSKHHRDAIKAANPDALNKDITGLIAKQWVAFKELVEDDDDDARREMKGYKKIVKSAKAKFDEEMESYKPSEGYDEKGRLVKTEDEESSQSEPDAKPASKKKIGDKRKRNQMASSDDE